MEELFETLPQHTCSWLKGRMKLYKHQGIWNTREFHEVRISLDDENYKAHPSDILLCSYPKSGTTWLKSLTYAIVTREKFDAFSNPLLTKLPHKCVPSLEKKGTTSPDLPLIGTHLPYSCLPKSFISSNCKMVYIYRNLKDVMVSYYHFFRQVAQVSVEDAPFEGAFHDFCQGATFCGPYWDHVLGYWNASQENPEKFLFLKYEDMTGDTTSTVKRLAEFTGYPFSVEEQKAGVVEKIIKLCSFQNLSNLQANKIGIHRVNESESQIVENRFFFRKGEVGDWENYFTDEMREIIDKLIDQKLSGTGFVLK